MVRRLIVMVALALVVTLLVPDRSNADASARIAGADRYATAAAVSRASFSSGVPVAFVVTGLSFPDALTAGPAAAHRGGPVLLVGQKTVPQSTRDELDRLNPQSIVVVGGQGAVSDAVYDEMDQYTDGSVTRVSGADRYASAAAVSSSSFTSATTVYVAGSERFSDALAGAPAAHQEAAPLLLVAKSSVPSSTSNEIRRLGASRVVILGGTASVDSSAESQLRAIASDVVRVAGDDRYATSVAASRRAFGGGSSTVYLASGAGYADALAAGPAAALAPGPILLTRANCVPPSVSEELYRLRASRVVLLGGTGALGTGVERLTVCPYAGAQNKAPSVESGRGTIWPESAPDPDLVRFGSTWYNYATGSRFGNHISVLTSTNATPEGGWRTTTGRDYGSTALPNPPSWQTVNTQWAPGVMQYRGHYVMFYAARVQAYGKWCVTVATASSPTGPFTDSSSGPMICQLDIGGSIDPQPFIDADGKPWLHWKNNDGSTADVSKVWAAPLDLSTGTAVAGPVREVMAKNTQLYTWQSTLDNPQMVIANGLHYLFYTSGNWQDETYRVGYAVCAGPVGPCTSGASPILQSYGNVAGPGGGTVEQGADGRWWMSYHAWDASCTNDACGGTRRLYVTPLIWR
jgi:putative cell wall-binding protein